MKRVIDVQLGARSYPVTIAPGLRDDPEAIKATCPKCGQVLPSNGELPLHLSLTAADLDGLDPEFDGEQGE